MSAKYGLISRDDPIPDYDYAMTAARAGELRPQLLQRLKDLLVHTPPDDMLICMGKLYRSAIAGFEELVPVGTSLAVAEGSIGRQQSILRDWLWKGDLENGANETATMPAGVARIRGVELRLAPEDVLDIAHRANADSDPKTSSHRSWYVPVCGHKVAPKWLVAQMTGLSVSSFTTSEALRVLERLGVEVRRV